MGFLGDSLKFLSQSDLFAWEWPVKYRTQAKHFQNALSLLRTARDVSYHKNYISFIFRYSLTF